VGTHEEARAASSGGNQPIVTPRNEVRICLGVAPVRAEQFDRYQSIVKKRRAQFESEIVEE
jgi:hypothetical protein